MFACSHYYCELVSIYISTPTLSSSLNTLCVASSFANKPKVQLLTHLVCEVVRPVCEPGPVWHCAVLGLSPYSASSISSHRLADLR